jgi:hypothetical protein
LSYEARIAKDARLFILKELEAQNDGRLNELLLQRLLEGKYGIARSREWVQTQMCKLAELEAVKLIEAAFLIADIERPGRDHLACRSVIAGITRPTEVE